MAASHSAGVWEQNSAQATILEFVRDHLDPSGCGLLPGGEQLPCQEQPEPGDDGWTWMAGAYDGVAGHHFGTGPASTDAAELITLMGRAISSQLNPVEFGRLYELLRSGTTIAVIDELLDATTRSALPRSGVAELARRLASAGRHAEPVKAGIALLGIAGRGEDRELLLTLGRHEEFTLFCAVAIGNSEPEPDPVLWSLARSVDGWGRIQTVERLRDTADDQIRDWILRHGFRNRVMNEYLAYIAATTGRLLERLEQPAPDDELVTAAGDIISALIMGGPAEDIDDYAEAPRLLSTYLALMAARASELAHYVVVDDIAGFLRGDDGWAKRIEAGWTQHQRAALLTACDDITALPHWPALARQGLTADDNVVFWQATRTAETLGINTFDAHWRRLLTDPLAGNWFAVMRRADEPQICEIIRLATEVLDPASLATGPADAPGLGPGYAAHNALSFVLQDLDRFPGHGWNLIDAGLRNPVVRVRNMAVKALRAWPPASWPAQAAPALERAARAEPRTETQQAMHEALVEYQSNS